jgi:hypothetical protein
VLRFDGVRLAATAPSIGPEETEMEQGGGKTRSFFCSQTCGVDAIFALRSLQ